MKTVTPEEATSIGSPLRNWNYQDALSEKQIREKLSGWRERLESSDSVKYSEVCQRMIDKYQKRLDALGVKLTCAG